MYDARVCKRLRFNYFVSKETEENRRVRNMKLEYFALRTRSRRKRITYRVLEAEASVISDDTNFDDERSGNREQLKVNDNA